MYPKQLKYMEVNGHLYQQSAMRILYQQWFNDSEPSSLPSRLLKLHISTDTGVGLDTFHHYAATVQEVGGKTQTV